MLLLISSSFIHGFVRNQLNDPVSLLGQLIFLDRFTSIREARGSNAFHSFIRNQLNDQPSVTMLDQPVMRALHRYPFQACTFF